MQQRSYLGTWELIPELSYYESGTAPASGTYVIEETASGVLALHVAWRMPGDSSDRTTRFGGRADGLPISLPAPPNAPAGLPDAFTLTHVDDHTLESAALSSGAQLALANRKISHDGQFMSVAQRTRSPSGSWVHTFQVYRRKESR